MTVYTEQVFATSCFSASSQAKYSTACSAQTVPHSPAATSQPKASQRPLTTSFFSVVIFVFLLFLNLSNRVFTSAPPSVAPEGLPARGVPTDRSKHPPDASYPQARTPDVRRRTRHSQAVQCCVPTAIGQQAVAQLHCRATRGRIPSCI